MSLVRPRVVLADDHDILRSGVRVLLERDGFEVCAEARDAAGAVEAVLREKPLLCVLDVDLAGGGIQAARTISRAAPDTIVVMLASSPSDETMVAAFRAGATGYLLKDTPGEWLPRALQAALRGEAPLSRALVSVLIDHVARRGSRHIVLATGAVLSLTDREWEVARLLGERRSTQDIADALTISPVTVRRHISEILGKLGVSSRKAAADVLAVAWI